MRSAECGMRNDPNQSSKNQIEHEDDDDDEHEKIRTVNDFLGRCKNSALRTFPSLWPLTKW
jgi:hypothetical protein